MDIESFLTFLGLMVSGFGLLVTAVGLFFAGWQLQLSRKIAKGDFLLRLDEMFWKHEDVHRRLRPGGTWHPSPETGSSGSESASASSTSSPPGIGPSGSDEWAQVESYMGLFERIKVLVDAGIIDLGTIRRLYGYRVKNIVYNYEIRTEKLEKRRKDWQDFIALEQALRCDD